MDNEVNGVLLVNKPKGITSFDVVRELTHIFKTKKIGHTGTLDPLAEGLLVITIGKANKIAELLVAHTKEYIAETLLGIETDTLDITGKVEKEKEVPKDIEIKKVLESFNKTYLQEVPKYSAIKINGKKLYEYARENKEVELPKKEVTISNIDLLREDNNKFIFRCTVTSGCYIRSLIRDIGLSLNTYATMTNLKRTKVGKFNLDNAYTLEDIKNNNYKLLSIEESLDYEVIEVSGELEKKISNGVPINNIYNIKDKVIFKNKTNLLGIYEVQNDMLKTWKNFN